MNNENQKLSFWHFLFLWSGAAISIAEIMAGGTAATLGFKYGLLSILVGHLIGVGLLAWGGIIGTRENIPSMTSTKLSFGLYGSYLFSILNVLQLLGWTAVMIKTCADSLNAISSSLWGFNHTYVWILVTGALVILWLAYGMTGFKKINTAAVFLLFLLTLVLGWIIFRNSGVYSAPAAKDAYFGDALELSVVMPLSWLPLIADYTRFAKTAKQGALGSFFGYFIGSSWMFAIGMGAAILSGNSDPSAMMLAANLGITAFAIVTLSTVTTTFMDAYSAGITFLNLAPKLKEKTTTIIMTVLGTLFALIFPIGNYVNFLYAIGSVFAPLFAVLLTDYFIIKRKKQTDDNILLNIGATIVWALGVALYYIILNKHYAFGATAPSMLITGLLYFISWRFMNKWILKKKSSSSLAA